jgi:hypothetical protein
VPSVPARRFATALLQRGVVNWCDRRCGRCPLADDCAVNVREQQRRWVHEVRGENADSIAVVLSDVEEEPARALAMLSAIANEEGIDLDAPLPPSPISLHKVKLQRAGLELAAALHAALESHAAELHPAPSPAAIGEAMAASVTLSAKCARMGSYLAERTDDVWAMDAVPNLLLMEQLRARLDDALASLETALGGVRLGAVRSARCDLDRMLDPLLASIQPTARCLLAGLVMRGAAPSPFSVTERGRVRPNHPTASCAPATGRV